MNRFLFLILFCVVATSSEALSNPPNIVYLISDDQPWTYYGFMGIPTLRHPTSINSPHAAPFSLAATSRPPSAALRS